MRFRLPHAVAVLSCVCASFVFVSTTLAQQKETTNTKNSSNLLNPEISAIADLLLLYSTKLESDHESSESHADEEHGHGQLVGEDDHGFQFVPREVEIDFRANVDPFTAFRTTLGFDPHGVHLEEAWFEWVGVLPHLNIKAGRFRQSLGPINQRHLHSWDQTELPLIMKELLGPEGLAQTGLSFHLLFGGIGDVAHTLTVEVTNSENEQLYGEEAWRLPATLAHFATHIPVGDAGYFEVGLAAQHGYHSASPKRFTNLYSGDLTIAYDPPGGADRFRMFLRGQWLATHKQETEDPLSQEQGNPAAHNHGDKLTLNHGAYAYLDFRFNRHWQAGVRGDWLEHDETWGVTPYLTFWQSEFVRLRLQYRATITHDHPHHLVALQLTGAVGPHRHEDY